MFFSNRLFRIHLTSNLPPSKSCTNNGNFVLVVCIIYIKPFPFRVYSWYTQLYFGLWTALRYVQPYGYLWPMLFFPIFASLPTFIASQEPCLCSRTVVQMIKYGYIHRWQISLGQFLLGPCILFKYNFPSDNAKVKIPSIYRQSSIFFAD